jgi:hypothetical protein
MYQPLVVGYLNTGRDLGRIESNSGSPIFSDSGEMLEGVTTLRAFGAEQRFMNDIHVKIDLTVRMFYNFWMPNRHLLLHFDALGGMGVLAATLFSLWLCFRWYGWFVYHFRHVVLYVNLLGLPSLDCTRVGFKLCGANCRVSQPPPGTAFDHRIMQTTRQLAIKLERGLPACCGGLFHSLRPLRLERDTPTRPSLKARNLCLPVRFPRCNTFSDFARSPCLPLTHLESKFADEGKASVVDNQRVPNSGSQLTSSASSIDKPSLVYQLQKVNGMEKRRSRTRRGQTSADKPGQPCQKSSLHPRATPSTTQPESLDLSNRSSSRRRDTSRISKGETSPSHFDTFPPTTLSDGHRSLYPSATSPSCISSPHPPY